MSPLLEVRDLGKSFSWRRPLALGQAQRLEAVSGVDLAVESGECLALVGESGSGKTTLGRCMIRLIEPDCGEARFDGEDLLRLSASELRRRRRFFQMVFQDAAGALDPRLRIEASIAEPVRLHRLLPEDQIPARARELMDSVGLASELGCRYPHQLSGGQLQRVGIARALASGPRLLILDEPVSALDASVRARILRLLRGLRRELELTIILIAHDLAMVDEIADRVAVMYLGRVVEVGLKDEVFQRPRHPYTASLLDAIPVPDPDRRASLRPLRGEIPSPLAPPPGCAFHPRCPLVVRLEEAQSELCRRLRPELCGADHKSACHFPDEVSSRVGAKPA